MSWLEAIAKGICEHNRLLGRVATALEGTPTDTRLAQVEAYANSLPDSVGVIKNDLLAIVNGETEQTT